MSARKSFASVPYDTKRKVTRRETFLGEMDRAIPWARIIPIAHTIFLRSDNMFFTLLTSPLRALITADQPVINLHSVGSLAVNVKTVVA